MELLLLEPLHSTAEEILQWANNPAAVHRYLDCLRRGWLGQAVRERYSFDNFASIPEGMLQTNFIQSDRTFMEWLKPIDDQIKEDLRGYISENDESIAVTRDAFIEGLQRTDDPGLDLLQELVEMMRVGLETMPKIFVTVLGFEEMETEPAIEIPWHYGLEDAITRLSAKVMDEDVLEMSFKKSDRDLHVFYRVDNHGDNAAALALVEELKHWQ